MSYDTFRRKSGTSHFYQNLIEVINRRILLINCEGIGVKTGKILAEGKTEQHFRPNRQFTLSSIR